MPRLFFFYTLVFFLCGMLFLVCPNAVIAFMNAVGGSIYGGFLPLNAGGERFWPALTFTMMILIAWAAFKVYRREQVRDNLNILLIAKATSSFTFFALFFLHKPAFAYLLGFAVDGLILLTIFYAKRRMVSDC